VSVDEPANVAEIGGFLEATVGGRGRNSASGLNLTVTALCGPYRSMLDGARAMAYETRLMVEPGCRGLHHLRAVLDCGDMFNNCSLRRLSRVSWKFEVAVPRLTPALR
jgi:hypothetical protein